MSSSGSSSTLVENPYCRPRRRPYAKYKYKLVQSIGLKVDANVQKKHSNPKQSIPCIYRVPEKLRKLKEGAYSPHRVSIGPLHMGDAHLKAMEEHKVSYMHSLFQRTKKSDLTFEDDVKRTLESCVDAMFEEVYGARACYADSFDVFYDANDDVFYDATDDVYHDATDDVNDVYYDIYDDVCYDIDDDFCYDVDNDKYYDDIAVLKFAHIMLIDGCFILELLYRSHDREDKTYDPIFDNASMLVDIRHDLVLIENQIPLSVLEKLFHHTVKNITNPPPTNRPSLPEYIFRFFGNMVNLKRDISKKAVVRGDHIPGILHKHYLPEHGEANNNTNHDLEAGEGKDQEDTQSNNRADHIIDLFHKFYQPSPENEAANSRDDHPPFIKYFATELDRAGVKFQAGERGVLGMSFNTSSIFSWLQFAAIPKQFSSWFFYWCGTTRFQISPLCIDDSTETFFMNLIAYEQCKSSVPKYVTSYAVLMNKLLNSKDDIQVLIKAKVLQNYEGVSEEALHLFNNVCKNVVLPEEDLYFSKLCKDLHDYLEHFPTGNLPSKLKRNCKSMVNYFFSSRWKVISITGALLLFALQVLQTVYTIRSSS